VCGVRCGERRGEVFEPVLLDETALLGHHVHRLPHAARMHPVERLAPRGSVAPLRVAQEPGDDVVEAGRAHLIDARLDLVRWHRRVLTEPPLELALDLPVTLTHAEKARADSQNTSYRT